MNYILINFLVFIAGILSSPLSLVGSESDSSVELSLSRLAEAVSKLRKDQHDDDRIDLDYFGAFNKFDSEYDHHQHTKDEDRFNSISPRYVYISNPEVLKDYQKKLKRVMVVRSSEVASLDNDDLSNLSVKDILEFLMQVEARMAEREGRTADDHRSFSFKNLEKILQNLRRQNEDFDADVSPLGTSSFISDTKEIPQHKFESDRSEEVRTTMRKKKKSKRERPPTTMKYIEKHEESNEVRPYRDGLKKSKRRERSEEVKVARPKKFLLNNDRFRDKRVQDRLPGFIGTPIPMIGKKSIYDTNK